MIVINIGYRGTTHVLTIDKQIYLSTFHLMLKKQLSLAKDTNLFFITSINNDYKIIFNDDQWYNFLHHFNTYENYTVEVISTKDSDETMLKSLQYIEINSGGVFLRYSFRILSIPGALLFFQFFNSFSNFCLGYNPI